MPCALLLQLCMSPSQVFSHVGASTLLLTCLLVSVQQKNISQIAGQAVGHGCSLTRSIPDSVAFPGYQAGNWTTPPGPPAPLMAGFTPISSAPVIPSSGGFYGYQGSQSNNKASPSSSPSPSSPSPSPSSTAGK